jgi:hypothetical protein
MRKTLQATSNAAAKLANIIVRLLLVFVFAPDVVQAQPAAKLDTVLVSGRGQDRWSARADAIRQALQQRVRQLVIADRAVTESDVLRDDVLSTMNGFVERFEVLRERQDSSGITLDARVIVGASAIELYIARQRDPSGRAVDGDDLLGKLYAIKEQEERRALVVRRLLEGFPWQTSELRFDSIGLDASDREQATVSATLRTSPQFLRQLNQGLKSLGSACSSGRCEGNATILLPGSVFQTEDDFHRSLDRWDDRGEQIRSPELAILDGFLDGGPDLTLVHHLPSSEKYLHTGYNVLRAVVRHERAVIIADILSVEGSNTWCNISDIAKGYYVNAVMLWGITIEQKRLDACIPAHDVAVQIRFPARRLEGAKSIQVSLLDDKLSQACQNYIALGLSSEFDQRIEKFRSDTVAIARSKIDPQARSAQVKDRTDAFFSEWKTFTAKDPCVKAVSSRFGLNNIVPYYNFWAF